MLMEVCNPRPRCRVSKKFEELIQKSGEHGHYFNDAISMQDKYAPSSVTIWCNTSEDDSLMVETLAGNARFTLSSLIIKREEMVQLSKDAAKIRVWM